MLLDTSGLLCCFDADESRHLAATEFYGRAKVRITHNYILAEFVALCQARHFPRAETLEFVAAIQADTEIELIWVDPATHDEALQLLQNQLDKSYSLCDAVSFVLMRRQSISDALTTDRHFEQAGFRQLLPK